MANKYYEYAVENEALRTSLPKAEYEAIRDQIFIDLRPFQKQHGSLFGSKRHAMKAMQHAPAHVVEWLRVRRHHTGMWRHAV